MSKRTHGPAESPSDPRFEVTRSGSLRRRVLYGSPIVPTSFTIHDGDDNGDHFTACDRCLPWSLDVTVVDGVAHVTEWHAIGCPWLDETGEDDTDGA